MSNDKTERAFDCIEWLRNNYQDHPNIASLCEAMAAARSASQPATVVPVAYANPVIMLPDEEGEGGEWTARIQSHRDAAFSMPLYAHPSAPAESGWQWVPVEPTDAMTWAGQRARYPATNSITVIYRAMLKAAPGVLKQEGGDHD